MDIGKQPLSITNNSNTHAVRHLQALLNEHGASIFIDGRYAIGTDLAGARFQSDNGLDILGYVDEATWEKLAAKPAAKKKPPKKKKPVVKTPPKKKKIKKPKKIQKKIVKKKKNKAKKNRKKKK